MPRKAKKTKDYLNEFIEETAKEYSLPGAAVGVWLRVGGLDYTAAVGRLDLGEGPPLRTDDIFHMASVSKLFVSMAVLQLAEQGDLDLDAPVAACLPWLVLEGDAQKRISPRSLLAHVSGLPDVTDYGWDKPKVDRGALKNYLSSEAVRSAALLWPPEEKRFRYSNLGYEILGAVIAEVSGMTFEDFMERKVFYPLFMNDSSYLSFKRSLKGRQLDEDTAGADEIAEALSIDALLKEAVAAPHVKAENGDVVRASHYPYNREHAPSSTLTSTLEDLRKWGDAFLRKEFFSEEIYNAALTPVTAVPDSDEQMGLGWFIRECKGYTFYGHEGMDDGFRVSFWLCPKLHGKLIVISNVSYAPVKMMCDRLFEIAINRLPIK